MDQNSSIRESQTLYKKRVNKTATSSCIAFAKTSEVIETEKIKNVEFSNYITNNSNANTKLAKSKTNFRNTINDMFKSRPKVLFEENRLNTIDSKDIGSTDKKRKIRSKSHINVKNLEIVVPNFNASKSLKKNFLIRNDSQDNSAMNKNNTSKSYLLKKKDLRTPIKAGGSSPNKYKNQSNYINDVKRNSFAIFQSVSTKRNTQVSLQQFQNNTHLRNKSENIGLFSNSPRALRHTISSDKLQLNRKSYKVNDNPESKFVSIVPSNECENKKSDFFLKNCSFLSEGQGQSKLVKKFQRKFEKTLDEIQIDEEKRKIKEISLKKHIDMLARATLKSTNHINMINHGGDESVKKLIRIGNLMPLSANVMKPFKLEGGTYHSFYVYILGQNFPIKIKVHGLYSYVDIAWSFDHKFPNYDNAEKVSSDKDVFIEDRPSDNDYPKNYIYLSLIARSTTKAHVGVSFHKKKYKKIEDDERYLYIPPIEETYKEVAIMQEDIKEETKILKQISKMPKERRNQNKLLNFYNPKNKIVVNEKLEIKEDSLKSQRSTFIDRFDQTDLSGRGIAMISKPEIENKSQCSKRIIEFVKEKESSKEDSVEKIDNSPKSIDYSIRKRKSQIIDESVARQIQPRASDRHVNFKIHSLDSSPRSLKKDSFLRADENYLQQQYSQMPKTQSTFGAKTKHTINSKSISRFGQLANQTDKIFNLTCQTHNKQSMPEIYLNQKQYGMSENVDFNTTYNVLNSNDINSELRDAFCLKNIEEPNKIEINKVVARNYVDYKSIVNEERLRKDKIRLHNAKINKKEERIEKINKLKWMINSHDRKKQEKEQLIADVQQQQVNQFKSKLWITIIYFERFRKIQESRYEAVYEKEIKKRLESYYFRKLQQFFKRKLNIYKEIDERKNDFTRTENLVSSALSMYANTIKEKAIKKNRNVQAKFLPEVCRVIRLKFRFDKSKENMSNLCHRIKHNYRISSYWYEEFNKTFEKEVMSILAFEEFIKKRESLRSSQEINLLENIHRFGNDFKKRMFKTIYNIRLLYHLKNISNEAETDFKIRKSFRQPVSQAVSVRSKKKGREEILFVTFSNKQNPKRVSATPNIKPRKLLASALMQMSVRKEESVSPDKSKSRTNIKNSANQKEKRAGSSTKIPNNVLQKYLKINVKKADSDLSNSDNEEKDIFSKIDNKQEDIDILSVENSEYYFEQDIYGKNTNMRTKPFRMKKIIKWQNILEHLEKDFTYHLFLEAVNRNMNGYYKNNIQKLEKYNKSKSMKRQSTMNFSRPTNTLSDSKLNKKEVEYIKNKQKHPAVQKVRNILSKYDHRKFNLELPNDFIITLVMTCQDFFDNLHKTTNKPKTQKDCSISILGQNYEGKKGTGEEKNDKSPGIQTISISCGSSINSKKGEGADKKRQYTKESTYIDFAAHEEENRVHDFVSSETKNMDFLTVNLLLDESKNKQFLELNSKAGSLQEVKSMRKSVKTRDRSKRNIIVNNKNSKKETNFKPIAPAKVLNKK